VKILNGAHSSRNLGSSKYIKIMPVLNCHSSAAEASVLGYDAALGVIRFHGLAETLWHDLQGLISCGGMDTLSYLRSME
jgi:hypothetical protein